MRVPIPLVYLLVAALVPLGRPDQHAVELVVSAALVVILFEGGRGIGLPRFRTAAPEILALGLVGTFATVAAAAVAVHVVLGVSWYLSLLLGTAVAPTDPAVVFSLLGKQELEGRSGTVLEGESGANDPVGIALLAALLAAGSVTSGALAHALGDFALQLVVGAAVGVAGGVLLRRVPGPVAALLAFGLFGVADLAHGSGFLAVFVAGIAVGGETSRIHPLVGTVGEAVAFVALGLTVELSAVADAWPEGVLLGLLLAFVLRPVVCWPLLPRLSRPEKRFVLLAGLKGAVPLLLGSMLLEEAQGERLYAVTVVVVVLSVAVQGMLVPRLARGL